MKNYPFFSGMCLTIAVILLLVGTLETQSLIIQPQNNFDPNQPLHSQRLLQFTFPDSQRNNPSGIQSLSNLNQKIQKFTFHHPSTYSNAKTNKLPDEEEIIYSNDLQIIAAFGIETGSKLMDFVKANIQQNRKTIFEHNWSNKKSYLMAQNQFIIYTPQEFRELYLTQKQPSDTNNTVQPKSKEIAPVKTNLRSLQVTSRQPKVSTISVSVNWRNSMKMTSVKHQRTCGSCYAFAPLAALESSFMIFKNKTLNLAEQELVDCTSTQFYGNLGCTGGRNVNSFRYIKANGIIQEIDYLYTGKLGVCIRAKNPFKYKIKDYVEIPDDCNAVIQALRSQPLAISANAEGWMYYSSGIFTDCKVGASNHGVVLAGVDSESWLIKNSWGTGWGESGYIKIARNSSNDCNVCKWAVYAKI